MSVRPSDILLAGKLGPISYWLELRVMGITQCQEKSLSVMGITQCNGYPIGWKTRSDILLAGTQGNGYHSVWWVSLSVRKNHSVWWVSLSVRKNHSVWWVSLSVRKNHSVWWVSLSVRKNHSVWWVSRRRDSWLSIYSHLSYLPSH